MKFRHLREIANAAAPSDGHINRHMHVSVPLEDLIALLDDRDALREALDQLRHDVDGYEQTFQHAEWIAAGRPGDFGEVVGLKP